MEKAEQGPAKYVRLLIRAARLLYAGDPYIGGRDILMVVWWGWCLMLCCWRWLFDDYYDVLLLGLAVPVVQVLATGRLGWNGIYWWSLRCVGTVIEALIMILLIGQERWPWGSRLWFGKEALSVEHLQMAASLAAVSHHPLSRALLREWSGETLLFDDVREYAGQGLEGYYHHKRVRLGSQVWCGDQRPKVHNTPKKSGFWKSMLCQSRVLSLRICCAVMPETIAA